MKKPIKSFLAITMSVLMAVGALQGVYAAPRGSSPMHGMISVTGEAGDFPVAAAKAAAIWVGADESAPVLRVVEDFRDDVNRVTGMTPVISKDSARPAGPVVVVGTLGSAIVGDLISGGKISSAELNAISGKWEAFLIKVIDAETLAVVGSDPRGAVYGVYEISEQMGVSPWYYFADVAVNTKASVYIKAGTSVTDMPDVQYRGIFINDEEKLDRWARQVMGDPSTMGPATYGKIFELLLRLKANIMWAAMHVNSFNNVQGNIDLIQKYGVILGSSHCDMLLRTNVHEWSNWTSRSDVRSRFGTNIQYDYTVSKDAVLEYWRENAIRHKDTEAQWTVGMRGPHDDPFVTANINTAAFASYGADEATRKANLLNEIVREQQKILLEVLGQEKYDKAFMTMIPYKEVLPIYNHPAFDLPENVTVIWCDDNHSIMRRMPDAAERERSSGHGIYYHVSYWAPADQSYMWHSSAPLSLIGSELDKCWENNVRKSWILNVGDIKPAEGELTFFVRYGWDVEQYKNNADKFVEEWIGHQFGDQYSKEVADILRDFYKHSNVRKSEHMRVNIFSQMYYGDEWAKRIDVYQDLFDRAAAVANSLPAGQRLGFYELVQCKINWVYYTNLAYYYADRSNQAYDQGRMASADAYLELSKEAELARKAEIAVYGTMANGKWRNFIDPENAAPPVIPQLPPGSPALVLGNAEMGVIVEGEALPKANSALRFSPYNQNGKFIDVFNKGAGQVAWTAQASQPWVILSKTAGTVFDEERVWVTIKDMESHKGASATITVSSGGVNKTIAVSVENPALSLAQIGGYAEADGYVSIQAENYSRLNPKGDITWRNIKNLGRGFDGDVMQTYDPKLGLINEASILSDSPSLEYDVYLTSTGSFPLEVYRVPTLNSKGQVRFAVSVDNHAPIVVQSAAADEGQGTQWVTNLFHQIEKHVVQLPQLTAGQHTIKLWMVDNFIGIDKLVIYTGAEGILPTELGPDESYHSVYNTSFKAASPELARTSVEAAPKNIPDAWGSGAFIESGGKVSIEAEYAMENSLSAYVRAKPDRQGNPGNTWRITQSPTGMAMRLPDRGQQWTESTDWPQYAPEMSYQVRFSTTGTYKVWVLWRYVDDASDSLRGGLNNSYRANSFSTAAFFSNNNDEKWYWQNLTPDSGQGLTISSAGTHLVNIWMREDGAYVDRIYLTRTTETPSNASWIRSSRTESSADLGPALITYIETMKVGLNIPVGTALGTYPQDAYDTFIGALNTEIANAGSIGTDQAKYDAALARITAAEAALRLRLNVVGDSKTYSTYQDFEYYKAGTLIPFGFTLNQALTDGSSFLVREENGNKFVRVSTSSTAGVVDVDLPYIAAISNATSNTNMMIVDYSARFTAGGRFANAFMPRINGSGTYAMTAQFENGTSLDQRQIRVNDGGTNRTVKAFNYDQWHDFRIVANFVTGRYLVYMDGEQIADIALRSATPYGTIASHRFGIDNFANTVVDFDNIRVSQGTLRDVTAVPAANGTVSISRPVAGASAKASKGEQVIFALTPNIGFRVKSGSLNVFKTDDPTTVVPVTGDTFIMPDYDVTITAEFEMMETNASLSRSDNIVRADYVIVNESKTDKLNASYLLALYNEDGSLKAVKQAVVEVEPNSAKAPFIEMPFNEEPVKAFIWDAKTYEPLCEAAVKTRWMKFYQNLALKQNARASSQENASRAPSTAVDGDRVGANSRWSTNGIVYPSWIEIDLGEECVLDTLDLYWFVSGSRYYSYRVWARTEPITNWGTSPAASFDFAANGYTMIVDKANNTVPAQTTDALKGVTARYVAIQVLDSNTNPKGNASFFEIEISGSK